MILVRGTIMTIYIVVKREFIRVNLYHVLINLYIFLLMRVHLLSACVTFMNIITTIKIVNSSYSMCYDEGEPELWGYMANGCPWSLM